MDSLGHKKEQSKKKKGLFVMADENETLAVIAEKMGVHADALRIASLIPGRPAVFFDDGACACAVGSAYWMQARAQAQAQKAIARIRGNTNKTEETHANRTQ